MVRLTGKPCNNCESMNANYVHDFETDLCPSCTRAMHCTDCYGCGVQDDGEICHCPAGAKVYADENGAA